ncbi:MAG TPA: fatty acid desaturase family protein [Nitrosomonas europaea]|uniref:fatty acid desaturase family protein n=1 Tax=Nitrosomonas europaea TaxID=915 RepID=UPI0024905441|nr:fatty acid desaturase family protein [Nitrosomonas europaea]HRN82899.1 fatty acid desaturase family protein [Nitrosomonas europaea]HRO57444.1 fatty acid desaturase family protein [Nitrosomonas europaea]HUM75104.1 fatty acid desaturase family protein [Nitrosomonas europaea]
MEMINQSELLVAKANEDLASENHDGHTRGIVLARNDLRQKVQELSIVNNRRFIWAITRQWTVIATAAAVAIWSNHWLVYLLMIIVIATRQHALGILMHDGTHYRCLTNRMANDIVCDIFCALPLGMLTSRYRYEHQLHHRFLNTSNDPYWNDFEQDPDWQWPKKKLEAAMVFLRDLTGLNALKISRVTYRWSPWINHFSGADNPPPLTITERITIYSFYTLVLLTVILTSSWLKFIVLWLIPLSTVMIAMMRLRTIAEHLVLPNKSELDASRHTDGTLLERLSISPLNINYHIDHHLFPLVPYYNLPELHKLLLQNEHYQEHAQINKTYLGIKNGLIGKIVK